ncbi:hypothetical protein U9M48_007348 [Paspalum notatum var. saurae]|uniref:Pollen Ole e 1 allergen and extensin family protein n=1 Tax=Paspalum notatum var. saurae TaxID=547442 RepID=A0AAQ3PRK5_PASNO
MAPRTRSIVLAALLALVSAVAQAEAQQHVGGSTVNPGVLISGIARCTSAPAPPIPHAGLQLVCSGSEVAGAAADDNGAFVIYLEPTGDELLADLLDNKCKVVVITPFIECTLPQPGLAPGRTTTTLAGPLQLVSASLGTGVLLTTVGSVATLSQLWVASSTSSPYSSDLLPRLEPRSSLWIEELYAWLAVCPYRWTTTQRTRNNNNYEQIINTHTHTHTITRPNNAGLFSLSRPIKRAGAAHMFAASSYSKNINVMVLVVSCSQSDGKK